MKIPKLSNPEKYAGLYIFDFGDHTGVGFTAEEVAELLESERYSDGKVYKIHNAYPDGKLELKGVPAGNFQLEMGMFFYSSEEEEGKGDFDRLVKSAVGMSPPCRAKVNLAKYSDDKYVTALIYPAEYNDEISKWLLDCEYKTGGAAQGGIDAVRQYYEDASEILQRHQLFAKSAYENRTGEELLANIKTAIQR